MRNNHWMRWRLTFLATMLLAAAVFAAQPQAYQSGKLVQMESVPCADGKTAKSSICLEYTLQTEEVIYRIQPKAAKHFELLPIGEWVRFRTDKEKLLLRIDSETASKEREFSVISIKPQGESDANVRPVRLNHLQ